ncbi:hypothetical protein RMSM_01527 [Rhodopirellula maiorica SM1]|uniref:Methyltransferase type 11 n=2 Tax=Novipirellula TaxID=2795426 RepID=M5RQD1_9BACT|nr:hypothetical protein RMSM_01527 [Rhodopirellula maiorica SM1]
MNYYAAVREAIEKHSPGESILDVGCGGTDTVMAGSFDRRYAVNQTPIPDWPCDAELIIGTWPEVELPESRFDVVTCCQVIEHLPDEAIPAFVAKLEAVAETLIVSVPFMWPKGMCKYHRQDPVDEEKFRGWFSRQPGSISVIQDGRLCRLVAVLGLA